MAGHKTLPDSSTRLASGQTIFDKEADSDQLSAFCYQLSAFSQNSEALAGH
jgi:hypothetical protein